MRSSWVTLYVAAAFLLAAHPARAQEAATGSISGTVTLAATGAPVHGATLLVAGLSRTTTTGEDGTFSLAGIPIGTYTLLAQREHFATATETVVVTAGSTATVSIPLTLSSIHEEVTVTSNVSGAATTFDAFSAISTVDSTELAAYRGATITEALDRQPGVSTRSFGAGSGRPIIRGFDGDRVLIMQDGVRTGDLSSQSADHGVTIDPAGLERIEIVKGPATLLYGSNAIGGVVNAITPQDAFRASPFDGLFRSATFDTGTTNDQVGGNASLLYGGGPWVIWGSGGARTTGDTSTPAGLVDNSATRLGSGRAGIGWTGTRAFWSVGGQFEDGRFGIPFAGEFHSHGHEDEHLDVDIATTRRDVRADAGLRQLSGLFENVKLTVAYTDYGHDELEIDDGFEAVGTRFSNDTVTIRLGAEQQRRGRLSGRLGFEATGRDFRATGEEALAPPTTQRALAAYAYEELDLGRLRLQFGGRIERNAYDVGLRPEGEHHHDDEEEGEEEEHEEHEPPAVRDRTFTGASGSFGAHATLTPTTALVANVSVASRAPALEELYNFGPHVGNLAFEIGNPDLDVERTVGLDVSLRTRHERLRAELNAFTYAISNFVFFDFTGDVVDGLREAEFLQGDSRYSGIEATAAVDLSESAHLHVGASYVAATLEDTDEALPRIPPLSGQVALEWSWRAFTVTPEVRFAARQDRVFRDETPTGGWATLNLGASWLAVRGHTTHSVTINAFNLTNREYHRHTSLIKDLAAEMGRGVRVSYTARVF